MNILCLSDLHGNLPTNLPHAEPEDVVVIAGDVCPDLSYHAALNVELQRNWLLNTFAPWVNGLKQKMVVMTWGNHDWVGQFDRDITNVLTKEIAKGFAVLVDQQAEVEDPDTGRMIRFYGTPWTPTFGHWAFMETDSSLDEWFKRIPTNLDVLISHGPPYGHCDRTKEGRIVGSKSLAKHITRSKPQYVICGHIHEGRGMARFNGHTTVFNVSYVTRDMQPFTPRLADEYQQYEPLYRIIEL